MSVTPEQIAAASTPPDNADWGVWAERPRRLSSWVSLWQSRANAEAILKRRRVDSPHMEYHLAYRGPKGEPIFVEESDVTK